MPSPRAPKIKTKEQRANKMLARNFSQGENGIISIWIGFPKIPFLSSYERDEEGAVKSVAEASRAWIEVAKRPRERCRASSGIFLAGENDRVFSRYATSPILLSPSATVRTSRSRAICRGMDNRRAAPAMPTPEKDRARAFQNADRRNRNGRKLPA